METGFRGTFVISWSQTLIDGYDATGGASMSVGSTWRWTGQVVRVDGHGGLLRLEDAAGSSEMRRRAAKTVRKLVGAVQENTTDLDSVDVSEPMAEQSFAVTDGRRAYVVTMIDVPGARPLAMFVDDIPPRDQDLWVVEHTLAVDAGMATEPEGQMICFTPGTRLNVASGTVDVTELRPGDLVQTKDNGLQEVLWTGARRITGARLHVMPDLAPVRIRADALGSGRPDQELLVSPEHRMLVKGAVARDLFNCDEVFVGARDLVDGHNVIHDKMVRAVNYVHILFERHEVVWANGLETESFHPSLASLDDGQRAAMAEALPQVREGTYSDYARRVLSPSEAAILRHVA
ncbi:Hint domain-containing protein [Shimia ponticola]|uniref:Hint domain-containing protein n=1 Tax=Shimia ponticola TaxID=2582893 RepID=UPI0011BEE3B7|nr:Hint domain-containing protein [Shimia ponticola]